MATNASVYVRFSDGSFTTLRDAISEDTLTEIKTDASGILNITGDVSIGQSNEGKIAVAALVKIQTDSALTGAFSQAAFYSPQGNVVCPIQGGGYKVSGLPNLIKQVRMETGTTVKVQWQAVADAVQVASLAVYTASGKCDTFSVLAVDNTASAMVNKDGSTIGQALTNETILGGIATYSALNGLADTGVASSDGINAFYVESSSGTLKAMYPPCQGASDLEPSPWIMQSVKILQNDTLTCMANV